MSQGDRVTDLKDRFPGHFHSLARANTQYGSKEIFTFCLFDLILYTPVNNFSVMSSWIEPVISKDQCVLLKDSVV